jgi:hypothetical protein
MVWLRKIMSYLKISLKDLFLGLSVCKEMLQKESSRSNLIKLFTAAIYECLWCERVFVPGKPFQPSLMFANKTGVLPCLTLVWSTFQVLNSRVGSWTYRHPQHKTWLERPASDKHSSSLRTFVNNDRKTFCIIELGQKVIKLFWVILTFV